MAKTSSEAAIWKNEKKWEDDTGWILEKLIVVL
jgi:hypothetical protein